MHFWRKDYFQTLRDIAVDASTVPEWGDYATFCAEYEREDLMYWYGDYRDPSLRSG